MFSFSRVSLLESIPDLKLKWCGHDRVGSVICGVVDVLVVDFLVLIVWTWAIITALSRITLGRHYVLDVLAGAFVGVLEGLFAFRFLRFEDFFR